MRRFVPLSALLLATTACGSSEHREQRSSEDLRTMDVREEAPPPGSMVAAPPNIGPTSAPGVAFNYRYAFRLPGERIASVQEQHAAACEKLGIDRCRITAMRYRLAGEDDVEAMIAFKLDPAIARQFGKSGADLVARSEGMLVDSEISGEDAGAEIAASTRSEAQYREALARIEQQLARSGLKSDERTELQAQADRLRESIRAARATRADHQESLAKTPVVFHYGSGDLVPGLDDRSPIQSALQRAGDNFVHGLAAFLVVGLTLLPWGLLLLLLIWIYRRFLRGGLRPLGDEAAQPAAH